MAKLKDIIKYQLDYTPGPGLPLELLQELNRWRQILVAQALIGQDPGRYGGYGYGNISGRLPPLDTPPHRRRFAISGTQTGHLAELGVEQYAVVEECYPAQNRIVATGPIHPSSESLTHGAVYDLDDQVHCVMHVHSPAIWQRAETLGVPSTRSDVPYGSPELAEEVARLFGETALRSLRIFAMGGHEDGVVSFGHTVDEAGQVLLAVLARAQTL